MLLLPAMISDHPVKALQGILGFIPAKLLVLLVCHTAVFLQTCHHQQGRYKSLQQDSLFQGFQLGMRSCAGRVQEAIIYYCHILNAREGGLPTSNLDMPDDNAAAQ